MKYRHLYLDDVRTPLNDTWQVVRNYDQFKAWLIENYTNDGEYYPEPVVIGLTVSFDHDLADEHYTPQELWPSFSASDKHQSSQNYSEKTGLDCAKLMVEMNLIPMECNSHSMNPVGQANICGYLDGWYRFNNMVQRCGHNVQIPFKV